MFEIDTDLSGQDCTSDTDGMGNIAATITQANIPTTSIYQYDMDGGTPKISFEYSDLTTSLCGLIDYAGIEMQIMDVDGVSAHP